MLILGEGGREGRRTVEGKTCLLPAPGAEVPGEGVEIQEKEEPGQGCCFARSSFPV